MLPHLHKEAATRVMAESPSKLAQKRQATRKAILEATSQIIAEQGAGTFPLSIVARRAGVNRSLIYHYFGNRDTLIVQAIEHIMSRYKEARPQGGAEDLERNARMHIEHPEIGRFLFQILLSGRQLPDLWPRLKSAIEAIEEFQQQHAPDRPFDPTFVTIFLSLAQLSWAFSRGEFARLLGISVAEADERFLSTLGRAAELGLREITQPH